MNNSRPSAPAHTAPPVDRPLPGATIGQAVARFWKKYATFSGRASRSEYWWWYLVALLVNAVLSGLSQLNGPAGATFSVLSGVWGLAILIPTLALLWRRLHDTNRSGLWALAPIVFWIAAGVLFGVGLLLLGTSSTNADTSRATLGGVLMLLAGVTLLVGSIFTLVLTLLPSNSAGERFDRS